jgi:hypothetical protein
MSAVPPAPLARRRGVVLARPLVPIEIGSGSLRRRLVGALGGEASLIVHELGHVGAARRLKGIRPSHVSRAWFGRARGSRVPSGAAATRRGLRSPVRPPRSRSRSCWSRRLWCPVLVRSRSGSSDSRSSSGSPSRHLGPRGPRHVRSAEAVHGLTRSLETAPTAGRRLSGRTARRLPSEAVSRSI